MYFKTKTCWSGSMFSILRDISVSEKHESNKFHPTLLHFCADISLISRKTLKDDKTNVLILMPVILDPYDAGQSFSISWGSTSPQ